MNILLYAAVAISACGVGVLLFSKKQRGLRRLRLRSFGGWFAILGVLIALTYTFILTANMSIMLSVVGILVSFFFGVGGEKFLRKDATRLKTGLIIASKLSFHQELRKGFLLSLTDIPTEIIDEYQRRDAPKEDLADFLGLLTRVSNLDPDVLVIWPPSGGQARDIEVERLLHKHLDKGGLVVAFENELSESLSRKKGVVLISSAHIEGGKLIAEYAVQRVNPGNTILVTAGPRHSRPAEDRLKAVIQTLENAGVKFFVDRCDTWAPEEAADRFCRYCKENGNPKVVITSNDAAGIAVSRALGKPSGERHRYVEVIGYDGLPEALNVIAEPCSRFVATIRIPPSAYGHAAANVIQSEYRRGIFEGRQCGARVLPITGASLITKHKAKDAISQ
jgi:hypothetical protein